jgi:hypothetical protein
MADRYLQTAGVTNFPALGWYAVTPSDSTDLATPARALYVGTGGNVALDDGDGHTAVVFKNVASGAVLPVRAVRVRATSTTATDIVALY